MTRLLAGLLLCILVSAPAGAQRASARFDIEPDTSINRPGWSALRVAKWTTLAASTGAAIYGFVQNRIADRDYEDIEKLCQSDPAACATAAGSDVYADAALEQRYQDVVRRDDRARVALLAGQIGLAASALMFILDLPKNSAPGDIPYEPPPVRVGVSEGQLRLGLTVPVR